MRARRSQCATEYEVCSSSVALSGMNFWIDCVTELVEPPGFLGLRARAVVPEVVLPRHMALGAVGSLLLLRSVAPERVEFLNRFASQTINYFNFQHPDHARNTRVFNRRHVAHITLTVYTEQVSLLQNMGRSPSLAAAAPNFDQSILLTAVRRFSYSPSSISSYGDWAYTPFAVWGSIEIDLT